MSGRGRPGSQLELPTWLRELIATEPAEIDLAAATARLRRSAVTNLEPVGQLGDLKGIAYKRLTDEGWVELRPGFTDSPVATALTDLVEAMEKFDLLTRMLIAMTDLEYVAEAARELAKYRHPIGGDEEPASSPYTHVEEILEAGLVVVYARSFTGSARLGDRWRPVDPDHRRVHEQILEMRDAVHAHADFTPARSLVDTNAMLGIEGPPIYAEQRARMSRDQLLAIAEVADAQHARFWDETATLKRELGSPAIR